MEMLSRALHFGMKYIYFTVCSTPTKMRFGPDCSLYNFSEKRLKTKTRPINREIESCRMSQTMIARKAL